MRKLILSLLIVGAVLSAYAQPGRVRSRTETKTIESTILHAGRSYDIYLPVSYDVDPDRKYPILYLFHGVSGTNKDWFERGHLKDVMDQLVASGEVCEMIIVSPEAGGKVNEAWNGYFDMPGWAYETFFFTELLPPILSVNTV